jgi:hypothetical protein
MYPHKGMSAAFLCQANVLNVRHICFGSDNDVGIKFLTKVQFKVQSIVQNLHFGDRLLRYSYLLFVSLHAICVRYCSRSAIDASIIAFA